MSLRVNARMPKIMHKPLKVGARTYPTYANFGTLHEAGFKCHNSSSDTYYQISFINNWMSQRSNTSGGNTKYALHVINNS